MTFPAFLTNLQYAELSVTLNADPTWDPASGGAREWTGQLHTGDAALVDNNGNIIGTDAAFIVATVNGSDAQPGQFQINCLWDQNEIDVWALPVDSATAADLPQSFGASLMVVAMTPLYTSTVDDAWTPPTPPSPAPGGGSPAPGSGPIPASP